MTTNDVRPLGTRCCDDDTQSRMSGVEAQQLSDALQLLGHPIRIQLLDVLTRHAGQVCVCDLEAAVPVKQPTVSHHLRLLRDAGLIAGERHGQWIYYSLQSEVIAALRAQISRWLQILG